MALIDEYKQAIQDVLDGRAKPAPKPSELPWTEDKAATMWAAAAAELIAEANSGGGSSGGGVLVVDKEEGTFNKTNAEVYAAFQNGLVIIKDKDQGLDLLYLILSAEKESTGYVFSARFDGNDIFFDGIGDDGYAVER